MEITIVEPKLPVPGDSSTLAPDPPLSTDGPINRLSAENVPSGRRVSITSDMTNKSGRKRVMYRESTSGTEKGDSKSRLSFATPSGLVTEVNLTRYKRDSMTSGTTMSKSATKNSSVPCRPPSIDIESSDLETLLGDDDDSLGRRLASLDDVDTLSRNIYVRKCMELGVVPISIVIRRLGEKHLSIRNRQCGPAGARAIAVPLVYNRSIEILDLSSNNITDEGLRPICDCLANNDPLRDLRLAENQLSLDGLKNIGRLVLVNKNITNLDISGNQFGDLSAKVLQKIIEETRTLRYLDLSNNNLGIEAGILLGKAIGVNESLEELRLCWNHIRLKGAEGLVKGLKENVRLRRLDLSWNGFGQESADCLGACLAVNEGLVELDMAGNRLNDQAMVMLAKGLRSNENLRKLVLVKNPITNVGAFALLAGVKQNENSAIQFLDMQDVMVREDFLTLLAELKDERQVKVLYNDQTLYAQIVSPMDLLLTFINEKGLDMSIFNLIANGDEPPVHAEKAEFIAQLKEAGFSLTHSQFTQLANSLLDDEVGLLNLSYIIEAANDLQAETASAVTSGTPDDMSQYMDDGSVAPSDVIEEEQQPAAASALEAGNKKADRKERSPLQAGDQYSW